MQLIQANKKPILKELPKLQEKVSTQQEKVEQVSKEDIGNETIVMGRNFFGDMLDIKEK